MGCEQWPNGHSPWPTLQKRQAIQVCIVLWCSAMQACPTGAQPGAISAPSSPSYFTVADVTEIRYHLLSSVLQP